MKKNNMHKINLNYYILLIIIISLVFPFSTWANENQPQAYKKFLVSAANPYAVEAGYQILNQGGSAVDAVIATQLVLGLVEPQSSGIGGGAFLLNWDNSKKELSTYDGRETSPMRSNGDLFMDKNGKPYSWWNALAGGKSVGVPGVLRMLELAHNEHGKLPWKYLFEPAIQIGEKGFKVSKRLHEMVKNNINPSLGRYDSSWEYFFPRGDPIDIGFLKFNKQYSNTLKRISILGADAFYKGDIAKDIVESVRSAKDNPGLLSMSDLYEYKAKKRDPICLNYRENKVCGMGPPTSGGITILQILGILENFELSKIFDDLEKSIHLITQASKLAFADRGKYIADPDFVTVPISKLIDKNYLMKRSKLIKEKDFGKAKPGIFSLEQSYNQAFSFEVPSTSHISIIDQNGNAVSMTTSIEMAFGSTLMVRGFLLNNQLTDFSFRKEKDGKKIANSVEPGKRPRSSMSPIIVFDKNNNVKLIIGSPGGSRIIGYVLKTLIAYLDWGMDIQDSINFPNFLNRNGKTDLEKNSDIVKYKSGLIKRGHKISVRNLNSGLHGISINDSKIYGGADFRREGTVLGK